jgi:hypothetical protein
VQLVGLQVSVQGKHRIERRVILAPAQSVRRLFTCTDAVCDQLQRMHGLLAGLILFAGSSPNDFPSLSGIFVLVVRVKKNYRSSGRIPIIRSRRISFTVSGC